MMLSMAIQLAASFLVVLFMAWLSHWLGLGGDRRICDAATAMRLASEAYNGFDATDVALDRAGFGALLKDSGGRHMLIRRNGAHFVGRLLDSTADIRLDQGFLTIATSEKQFGRVTLNLGEKAQYWASGLRHLHHE
jgi:hypothetical protein